MVSKNTVPTYGDMAVSTVYVGRYGTLPWGTVRYRARYLEIPTNKINVPVIFRSYPKIRWVDLDRPLKKQLDKYSREVHTSPPFKGTVQRDG